MNTENITVAELEEAISGIDAVEEFFFGNEDFDRAQHFTNYLKGARSVILKLLGREDKINDNDME